MPPGCNARSSITPIHFYLPPRDPASVQRRNCIRRPPTSLPANGSLPRMSFAIVVEAALPPGAASFFS